MKCFTNRSYVSSLFNTILCQARVSRSKRAFTTSLRRCLRTSEFSSSQLEDLKANADRLWNDIHYTAQCGIGKRYGGNPEAAGMSRLTLSDVERKARDWFVETAKNLSCETHVDKMGNVFAIRPGLDNSKPATYAGSHLNSQPTGGCFDGVLGVCEMLRVLAENWIETESLSRSCRLDERRGRQISNQHDVKWGLVW